MLEMILTLIGGLALFLYGMQNMSDGLRKAAGDKMRRILEALTTKTILGVLVGTFVTALIQSSSATTVMVIGFVNAGLMTLKQAIGVIMGANIGTTVTAQIIAFNISQFVLPIIAIGVGINFFGKGKASKYFGQILLGFGILMLGMGIMSDSMRPLAENRGFLELMKNLGHQPLLGLAIGIVFTAIMQSSSATIGILIALSTSGLLSIESALPILLGTNIGTCVTAVLASIGTSLTAKRAAAAHVFFNIIGSLVFLLFLNPFADLVKLLSNDTARQIANVHTLFNIINTVLFLPLVNQFASLITKIVPGQEEIVVQGPIYLDQRMLGTPAIGLSLASKEIVRMANIAYQMVMDAMESFVNKDEAKVQSVYEQENLVDELADQITTYLAKLAQTEMTPALSKKHTGLLHSVTDIERIGDHAENIAEMAIVRIQENLPFSEQALEELAGFNFLVEKTYMQAISALQHDSQDEARETQRLEKRIDVLEKELRRSHISRLNTGKCFPGSGVVFLDIISNLERVGDHANNIAVSVLGEH